MVFCLEVYNNDSFIEVIDIERHSHSFQSVEARPGVLSL